MECGVAGADLDDMGFSGSAWVAPMYRTFDRAHGEITLASR
jgi:hypothetical protein